jgi:galactokinase
VRHAELATDEVRVFAPGRVNLIGDHTDYTGGLVLPMAIQLGTTLTGFRRGARVRLQSSDDAEATDVPIDVEDPATVSPAWARYVAGVVSEVRPASGLRGTVSTTLPIGSGLSSSAALELAVALALGADDADPLALAQLCQRAEHRASGVPCGIMDQLAIAAGVEGHALLIDCHTLHIDAVAVPDGAAVIVVDSGQSRELASSAYAERRAQCEAAEALIGPLRAAVPADIVEIGDRVVRRRACHVMTENERVVGFARALRAGDLATAGALMVESHRSLRDDFEVSTPVLDELVADLCATPGVYGARLTGAGFGGCVVALADPDAVLPTLVRSGPASGWRVRPSAGARREVGEACA